MSPLVERPFAFPNIRLTNTTNGTAATATAAVNLPGSIVAGELLLVLHRNSVGTATHSYPGDWSVLFNDNSDGSDDRTSLAYKLASGTEGATISVGQTSSKFASASWAIKGAENPAVQPPQFASLVTGASTTPDPGSLSPTGGAKDYLWIWMGGWEGEQTSPPSGNPADYGILPIGANSGAGGAVATNCRVAGAARQFNTATQDPGSWTIDVSDDWTATVVAVHPARMRPIMVSLDSVKHAATWCANRAWPKRQSGLFVPSHEGLRI